jgi:glyoxylase-like metal-dependent hydrolase (beta-lactamase superfamily II)
MQIKVVKVGSLQTNCYVVIDELSKEAIIIDPADEAAKISPLLAGLTVPYIIVTHGHPDHFGALDELKKITGAQFLAHQVDNWFYRPDRSINEGDKIRFGQIELTVYHTPGHTGGGICLYTPGHLFAGDTLFLHTYGRTDLPGGSEVTMQKSLSRLAKLPGETIVYPGHGQNTTIAEEKEYGTLG